MGSSINWYVLYKARFDSSIGKKFNLSKQYGVLTF